MVTISFFKFNHNKWWAFKNFRKTSELLRSEPGLSFSKMMGSGAGEGFSLQPDFSVYSMMMVHRNPVKAEEDLLQYEGFRQLAGGAYHVFTVFMQPLQSHGQWNGQNPFASKVKQTERSGLVGVLTRASIKKRQLLRFWERVPSVSRQIASNKEVIFSKGIGEIPLLEQATFSIWPSQESIHRFAYQETTHNQMVKLTRKLGWYKEELFARFDIVNTSGDFKKLAG